MARSKRLLEPKEAKVGAFFLDTLAYLHIHEEHPKASEIGDDFQVNKQVVARMSPFRCERYGDLPADAKSFVSKCAGIKGALVRKKKKRRMTDIVIEQFNLVQHLSDKLYKEVFGMLHAAADEILWKRRREKLIAEWYADAAKDPLHAYHPDDVPHEFIHTNPQAMRPLCY
jgi:hypothetical protein